MNVSVIGCLAEYVKVQALWFTGNSPGFTPPHTLSSLVRLQPPVTCKISADKKKSVWMIDKKKKIEQA